MMENEHRSTSFICSATARRYQGPREAWVAADQGMGVRRAGAMIRGLFATAGDS
jgi:hypothetical protein